MANSNGTVTIWKAIALISITALIGLSGSMVYVIHTWAFGDDIEKLDRQVEALRVQQEMANLRLAVLEAKVEAARVLLEQHATEDSTRR